MRALLLRKLFRAFLGVCLHNWVLWNAHQPLPQKSSINYKGTTISFAEEPYGNSSSHFLAASSSLKSLSLSKDVNWLSLTPPPHFDDIRRIKKSGCSFGLFDFELFTVGSLIMMARDTLVILWPLWIYASGCTCFAAAEFADQVMIMMRSDDL